MKNQQFQKKLGDYFRLLVAGQVNITQKNIHKPMRLQQSFTYLKLNSIKKMLESRPEDALVKFVKLVNLVKLVKLVKPWRLY